MSRSYGIGISIIGVPPSKHQEIEVALEEEWPFSNWFFHDEWHTLAAYGESQLCGGETEEEFSERMMKIVWKANGEYCDVTICATLMEDLPYESYTSDEDMYERLMGGEE